MYLYKPIDHIIIHHIKDFLSGGMYHAYKPEYVSIGYISGW